MTIFFKKTVLTTLCASSLLLSACGGDGNSGDYTSRTDKKTFTVDADVSNVANVHDVFTYKMPSVQNKEITATTLVFTPKGTPPIGGWPIVVWAHGTVGAADKCAPSKNPLTGVEKNIITALLQKGYAVIAPDYEGLGNSDVAHPFLNLSSAAKSVIFAVDGVNKRYANLSKNWSVIGWSQGGHAALAAAEFSSVLNPSGYQFKGTVAIAPASYLQDTLDLAQQAAQSYADAGRLDQAVPIAAKVYTYAAIVASGIKARQTDFTYDQAFLATKVSLASKAETVCSPELGEAFGLDIQTTLATNGGNYSLYQALQPDYKTNANIVRYVVENNPGQLEINKPVYIYQGTADTTVPYPITHDKLYAKMLDKGTDVHFIAKSGDDHQTIMEDNIAELADQVNTLMTQ